MTCKHISAIDTFRYAPTAPPPDDLDDLLFSRRCAACGEQLPLGPADEPLAVLIEIRAARLGGDGADVAVGEMTEDDRIGRLCALTSEPGGFSPEPDQLAGWLSMVIEAHDLEHMDDDVVVGPPYEEWAS